MRVLIEHLRLRTIPHDLMEFFSVSNVPFYEGCMIVQVYDHKSTAPSPNASRAKIGPGKAVPFSVHNYNQHLTPSPYVPFPMESLPDGNSNTEPDNTKDSEQKDKENMPAPAVPSDGQRSKTETLAKKPKVSTIILHPTAISNHADMSIKAADSRSTPSDGRVDSRQEMNGPLSATVPLTPSTAVPPTPQASMAPPAKRQKKSKAELDSSNLHAVESQVTLATTAPLVLDTVSSAAQSVALLASLAHPMYSEKPPSPKTRKRTVAEMAADEALAVAQERYMLCLDERLSSSTAGAQGGANPVDGDGQAGGASFEPRFERFKTLENIRIQHEENKKAEKARQAEAERKAIQDRERERLRLESEKRDAEKMRQQQLQQEATRRQQEAHRRVMSAAAQQSQPNLSGVQPQVQGQHGHPQQNNIMPNGIPGQPQRFHQQQVSQAQLSSPIVRNGTPQSHMSPTVNNMGNIPMQHSTSSMGGSPPRPGSAVHLNHPQMGGPTAHNMTAQRSQQSHGGTPRMPNATPNLQSTPLSRQMSQTPRMNQASPLQGGPIGQVPHMQQQMMGPNGQPINLNAAQQQQFQQQQQALYQQRIRQQQASQGIGGSINGQPMNQQQMLQAQQMMRAQQQANQLNTNQMAQNYSAQMAAMQRSGAGIPPNMNFPNAPGVQNMQQLQQLQQMQQMQQMQQYQQAQVAQAQAQAQAQHPQQMNPQMQQQQMMMRKAISGRAHQIYQQQIPQFQAQYPGGIPDDVHANLRRQCQQTATAQINQQMNASRMQQQQQMMAAQHGGMQPNGMQNGMGMQRPQ